MLRHLANRLTFTFKLLISAALLPIGSAAVDAHTCGPDQITMYPGDVVTWQVTAATNEPQSEYNVPIQPNAAVATATWPGGTLPFMDHHATFEITAIAPGTTLMAVNWYYALTDENGFCEVEINVLPPVSLCQATDPPGDAVGPNTPPFVIRPDIVESNVTYDGATFVVEVTCNAPVMLPSQALPMSTFLNIEFDTDNNSNTGWEPYQNFIPWLPKVDYGAEAALFVNWDEMNHPGQGNLIFFSGAPGYLVPVTYSGNTISFDIPDWVLQTSSVRYAPMVGNMIDWTDALEAAAESCADVPTMCEADLDDDGDVDHEDAIVMGLSYGTTPEDRGFNPDADLDGNGVIDLADLGLLLHAYYCPSPPPTAGGVPNATVSTIQLDPAAEFDPISPLAPGEGQGFRIQIDGTPQPNITAAHATITISDPLNAVTTYVHDQAADDPWLPPSRSQFPQFPALQHTTGFRFSADDSGFFMNTLGESGGQGLHWKAQSEPGNVEDIIGWFRVEQTAEGGSIVVQSSSGVASGDQQVIGSISVELTAAGFEGQVFTFDFDIVRVFNSSDVNGDGSVNVDDLLAVISAWGNCPPPCPADVNGDGTVNVDDLLMVINGWG